MFKAIILLKRNIDATHHEFKEWWIDQHAPLVRQLPGLIRATFNLVDAEDRSHFDGVSELWFESRADFEEAYGSEIGRQVVSDSEAHVCDRIRLLCQEHPVKE